ncbi:hypothetical protein R9X50_00096600 [Acrodontium crateriforme]|uniref:Zn(2)-C6 fungal-type domain-containing protein n=1 Tax=Acrodontium crateriforme TaxID=150365 RepID=A0AAQ3M1J3_9PEZI|nr:hypothetical protein R9X50_00096600 [Acrodontium crateriforme]
MALSLASQHGSGISKPSRLACGECRSKHLKCNGSKPRCARCTVDNILCTYTPSRRGRTKRPKSTTSGISYMPSRPSTGFQHSNQHSLGPIGFNSPRPTPFANTGDSSQRSNSEPGIPISHGVDYPPNPWTSYHPHGPSSHPRGNFMPSPSTGNSPITDNDDREGFIDLYYSIFHPSHPLLVPRTLFAAQQYPAYLKLVLQLIGSHYATTSTGNLREQATAAVDADDSKDAHKVQALVLLAIALHGRYEPLEAQNYIMKAVRVAVEIGLNLPEYATAHTNFDPVVTESLRRTWWELFVVDGYIAALHQMTSFGSNMVQSHALLPCEEAEYESGVCPSESRSLQDLEGRLYQDDGYVYSSFCYRIEAIRILARVLAVTGDDLTQPDDIQSVDNAIRGWRYHIPESKMGSISSCDEFDHLIFQGQIFINCAGIILHFPRSRLPLNLPSTNIECAQHMVQSSKACHQHVVKAISESEHVTNLASVRGDIEHFPPFFICGLVLGCVVQLSAFSGHSRACAPKCLQKHRDQVGLTLAALTALSRHWGVATHVLYQLKFIAQRLFNPEFIPNPPTPKSSLDGFLDAAEGIEEASSWLDTFFSDSVRGIPQDVTNFGIPM